MDGFVPTVHQNCDVPAWVPRCTSEVKTNSLIDMRIKLHKILRLSIINFAVRGHSLIWESSGDNWIGLGGRVVKAHFNASHQSPCPPGGTCIPSSQIPVSAAARPGNISSVGYWVHTCRVCRQKPHTYFQSTLPRCKKKMTSRRFQTSFVMGHSLASIHLSSISALSKMQSNLFPGSLGRAKT